MAIPVYQFTLPVSGTKIQWSPLTVGIEIDVMSEHSGKATLAFEYLRRRIIDAGNGKPMEFGALRAIDSLDLEMFQGEVERVESERRKQFIKGSDNPLGSSST